MKLKPIRLAHVRPARTAAAVAASAAVMLGGTAFASAAAGQPARGDGKRIQHVLLISVDGLHQQDLAWYVHAYPSSVLAAVDHRGLEYSNAETPFPSDSSPGMTAQVTGGNPRSTGIYYDDTFNHDLFPAGTMNCSGPVPGAEAAYEEAIDVNSNALDAGEGLTGLPGSILQMTGNPLQMIDPKNLPVDPEDLQADLPEPVPEGQHDLQRGPRGRAAYRLVGQAPRVPDVRRAVGHRRPGLLHARDQQPGPPAYPAGDDWTSDNAATMQYDSYKVQAILNEIDGYDHSGTHHVGVPGIFGMNFQTVSTAQKLPTSDGLTGGYLPGGTVPGPLLVRALNYIDTEIGAMVARIQAQGLAGSTALIISAKHGQSPTDPTTLARVPDSPIISAINAAWTAAHPGAKALVIFSTDDDGMLLWLSDRSQAAADFVKNYLLTHSAAGNNVSGNPVTVSASGLKAVYAGAASAAFYRRPGQRSPAPGHHSASPSTASSTPAGRPRSPSTAGTTRRTATCPSSWCRRACRTAPPSGLRSRRPRSPRPSWRCSA